SIMRYCAAHQWPGQLYCIHSCKSLQDCAFYEELCALQETNTNIHVYITCTQEDDIICTFPQQFFGRINKAMIDTIDIKNIEQAKIYLCGGAQMCSQISTLLQNNYTVSPASIHQLSLGTLDKEKVTQKI